MPNETFTFTITNQPFTFTVEIDDKRNLKSLIATDKVNHFDCLLQLMPKDKDPKKIRCCNPMTCMPGACNVAFPKR